MIAKHFHRSWYASDETYLKTRWRGVRILKCPLDLWVYQEILHATRPDLVIETGTGHGGSAYYFASLFDLPKHGEIITIDIEKRAGLPIHPRITYLNGSATDPAIIATVRQAALGKTSVMAVLDSDHSEAHALEELRSFSPLVTEGNYLVVEDTHIGHPVPPFSQTGPMEAVRRFLQENNEFGIDADCERLQMSFNYQGYLKRIKPSPTGSIHGST
ncbi:MAG: cephalosporin hydroxylase [Chloroflexi bacterium]|nr:cephalosporin hydroxylase [Chloroflexota bacterium]